MSFDALTMTAVRDELRSALLGGHVRRVVQVGVRTVGLEVYARGRHFVLCSAEAEAARAALTLERPSRESDKPSPFLLLARKHLRGGRVVAIDQPPYERVLKVRVSKRDEHDAQQAVVLIIEAMGRRSNVILATEDGRVLEALRRTPPSRNPRRPVQPGQPYLDPPAQDRLDPLDPNSYCALAARHLTSETLEEVLAQSLAGFSPTAAREVAYRATGRLGERAGAADWRTVQTAVFALLASLSSGEWRPSLVLRDDRVVAFAPYILTHVDGADVQQVSSISEAIERALGSQEPTRRLTFPQRQLSARVGALRVEAARKCGALERSLASGQEAGRLREAGELILANLGSIEPEQTVLQVEAQEIPLRKDLTPLENAQRYFHEYRKARDAGRQVPALLKAAVMRLRQLDELLVLSELAEDPASQLAVADELAELTNGERQQSDRAAKPKKKGKQPGRGSLPSANNGHVLRRTTPDGLEVLVGASSRGNETVTFKLARADDLWFHARGIPGAHVILRTAGAEPSRESLVFAARLAARSSKARTATKVDVDWTARRNVKKVPAAPPGFVTYHGERTVSVAPDG